DGPGRPGRRDTAPGGRHVEARRSAAPLQPPGRARRVTPVRAGAAGTGAARAGVLRRAARPRRARRAGRPGAGRAPGAQGTAVGAPGPPAPRGTARPPRLRRRHPGRSAGSAGPVDGARTGRVGGGEGGPQLMLAAATSARWRYDFELAQRLVRAAQELGAGFEADLLAARLAGIQG